MCAKTAAGAARGGGGKDRKPKRGKRPSSTASSTAAKSAVKSGRGEGRTAAAAAKGSRMPLKSPAGSEENDDTEQDVRRAYYAVRRSACGKMIERGGRNPISIAKSILVVF